VGPSKGDRSARIGLILFGVLFVSLLVLCAGETESASVRLPAGAIAVVEAAPPGTGTVSRAELQQALRQQAGFAGLKEPPKPGDEDYESFKEAALGELLTVIWLSGQAEELGIRIGDGEIAAALTQEEEASLREAGFTRTTLEERAMFQLLQEKIEARLREEAPDPSNPQGYFSQIDQQFTLQWSARTSCAEGFVLPSCSNYVPVHPLGASPGCYEADPEAPAEECPAPVVQRQAVLPGSVTEEEPTGTVLLQHPVPSGTRPPSGAAE
jgi:hypothetical protein